MTTALASQATETIVAAVATAALPNQASDPNTPATPTPLASTSAALRVSFKELPIDGLNTTEVSDCTTNDRPMATSAPTLPAADIPSSTVSTDERSHVRAATSPSATTAQAALQALQQQRQDLRKLPADPRKRPNSFSGPIPTQPRSIIKGTGSHSVGTPRQGEQIGSAKHLIPLSEIEASSSSSPRKRGSSVVKKHLSGSEMLEPEKIGRRLTRQRSEKEVLVGTPVKEGHDNYVLMYDMLTGIRVSVSRCQAKPPRVLQLEDFTAAHKMTFDVTGNELTPSSRYDFKFKDYAPWVFRCIRDAFHVDPAEYLLSLTGKYVLSELVSAGKSGSFFYYSSDYRFIIKTVHHSEHKYMRKILRFYYEHVRVNQHTLLSRIFGLHRVKLPGNRKIHFVVMGNVFPPNKDIHEMYDLKGSTVGREYPEELAKDDPRAVLKDLNWMHRKKKLDLGPQKRQLLVEQLERDVEFLIKHKIMDYSLLVGIHDLKRGNKEKIRDKTLAVYEPNPDSVSRQPTSTSLFRQSHISTGGASVASTKPNKRELRRMLSETEPLQLGPSNARLPDLPPSERTNCVFYQDDGGFAASDENNEPMKELYYIGVIDIFTKYDMTKKVEHFWKSFSHDRTAISAVNPVLYGHRFLKFMKAAIRGYTPEDEAVVGSRRASGTGIAHAAEGGVGIPQPVGKELLEGMEERAIEA
ncbi:1-phosphatidylinositol-4-phosphate 5-kinase [Spizellomyces punctatus DAOM BR117]|uniref:1-phosphatidylinositol-4-phosphate 5-kinase n=1 Tax=Spizellomyces punctatus (strain DAOM BR117) TaxID=645134 RepID=A0A0L0HQ34_SPIPD|nr:1-phosphatidylinositol-4-phosphate 5-kinase [Spizellomyces punctatus DAOM BR117]KND03212.1 hypothetical protein SPPG_02268 [Spizellomyces punctatus DAOM BR117]|eukprot:XP_016611251.1 hypothetical protein SPPG_02268 [Spizellomyces punctatus DAOM BR117]